MIIPKIESQKIPESDELADNDRNLHSVAILNSTRLEGLGIKVFVSTHVAAIVGVAQLSRLGNCRHIENVFVWSLACSSV